MGMGILVIRDTGRHLLIRLLDPESSLVTQTGGGLLGIGSLSLFTSILGCTNGLRTTPLSWVCEWTNSLQENRKGFWMFL